MLGRLRAFAAGSLPPRLLVPLAAAWALGGTALFALVDPRGTGWRPDLGTVAAVGVVLADLVLIRAFDDIRDLDYDRRFNPDRPLARGSVRPGDLAVLAAGCGAAMVALTMLAGAGTELVAVQLGYCGLLLAADRLLGWPPGDRQILSVLISAPIQVLLNGVLYAIWLHSAGLPPDRHGALGLAILLLVALHHEIVRKAVRHPRPGQRTYTAVLGQVGAVSVAMIAACAAAVLVLAAAGPPAPAGIDVRWLVLVPLGGAAVAAARYGRRAARRWSTLAVLGYLVGTYAAWAVTAWTRIRGGA